MNWQKELDLAITTAKSAGQQLKKTQKGRNNILSDEGRDIKLSADRESETIILQALSTGSDYSILAEESGEHGILDSDSPIWIIDPLDGTMNYSRELPLCCVSIALWHAMEPILGVIYDFNREELFFGLLGKKAWCGESVISVSDVSVPDKAILATGFPVNRDFSDSSLKDFLIQVQCFKKVRMFGSAALSLAYVACGRIDAYAEEDIMLWDIAAGVAIVKAAGGHIKIEKSAQLKWGMNVKCASNLSIWKGDR